MYHGLSVRNATHLAAEHDSFTRSFSSVVGVVRICFGLLCWWTMKDTGGVA